MAAKLLFWLLRLFDKKIQFFELFAKISSNWRPISCENPSLPKSLNILERGTCNLEKKEKKIPIKMMVFSKSPYWIQNFPPLLEKKWKKSLVATTRIRTRDLLHVRPVSYLYTNIPHTNKYQKLHFLNIFGGKFEFEMATLEKTIILMGNFFFLSVQLKCPSL